MKKQYFALISTIFAGITLSPVAKAVCPVCVVAVGAGLGFSRWLGVDDTVSSIWIGAILVSVSWWTIIEMRKRNWGFKFDAAVISLAYYLLTFVPIYYAGILGHPLNQIFGIDKIVFGTILGTAITLVSDWLNLYLKKKNNGKAFFPYQKVAVPVVILILTSIIFYLLILYRFI